MSSLDPSHALPALKSFTLTHILYDPLDPLSIPLTLLSLSPIFLFVSYFTLLIFTRRLTILLLALGSVCNEVLSLVLKERLRGERPYKASGVLGEVGEGWGMPSSHSQAAGFLAAWGLGYALTRCDRHGGEGPKDGVLKRVEDRVEAWRIRIYLFGLMLWSVLVAYSRWHLMYHSPIQVIAGYAVGLLSGSLWFILTELLPLNSPQSLLGRLRRGVERLWRGVGGVGGWRLGDADGGWGEGWLVMDKSGETSLAARGSEGTTRSAGKKRS